MLLVFIALVLMALAHAATVVPLQSSQVDVRRSGAEFSYNIQENHGVAAVADPVPLIQPLVKSVVHLEGKPGEIEHAKEGHGEHHQEQIHHDQKIEARANLDFKDPKKPEELALITQPLLASPLEYYAYYYPYTYTSLPKASIIPSISTIPAIPYPYTLIKTI